MSLLNDVLRDLDARRAETTAGADLQREIRSLPVVRERPHWARWLGGALLLTGVGAAVLWMQGEAAGPWSGRSEGQSAETRRSKPAEIPALKATASDSLPAVQAPAPVADAGTSAVSEPVSESSEPSLRAALQLDRLPRQEVTADLKVVRPRVESAAKSSSGAVAVPASARSEPATVSASLATPAKQPPDVSEGVSRAAEGKSAGVVEKKPVLATSRDRAEAELHIAQSLLAQGRVTDAIDSLRAALRYDPGHSPSRQLWLKVLLEGKRSDEAIAVLQEGLEVQANQTGWAMTLARLLVEKNDPAAAERVLGRSWPYGGSNPAYAGFYGHLRGRLGQHREAVELYQVATRLAPAEGRWWFGLASSLDAVGRSGEAREAYRQAQQSGNLPAELVTIAEQRLAR